MSTRTRRNLTAGLLLLGVLVSGSVNGSAQCAMCRSVLASPEGQNLASALRSGILVLLAAPFASFAAVAVLAVRRHRRRTSMTR